MDQAHADPGQLKPISDNPIEVLMALGRELDHEIVPAPPGGLDPHQNDAGLRLPGYGAWIDQG